jgi:hypothetical protein
MALEITDRVWSIGDLIEAALKTVPTKPTPTPAQRRKSLAPTQFSSQSSTGPMRCGSWIILRRTVRSVPTSHTTGEHYSSLHLQPN